MRSSDVAPLPHEHDPTRREQLILEALAEMVWSTDSAGNSPPNPAWARLTGMAVEATAGQGWLDAVHPDDLPRLREAFHASIRAPDGRYRAEYRGRMADGSWRWFESRGIGLRGPDGRIAEWIGVTLDIDDRKVAQAALDAALARLRLAQEATLVGIWEGEIATRSVSWSPEVYRLYGRDPALGPPRREDFYQLIHPDDVARVMGTPDQSVVTADGSYEVEFRVRHPERGWRWLLSRARVVERDGERQPLRVLGINIDITDLKEAEELRRESEARLSAVLDALPVGVVIADAGGRIVRDNAANRDLWGVPPETGSWEGYGDWVAWWPATGERIRAHEWAMARAIRDGEVVRGELIQSQPFGSTERRFFINNAAPVRARDGRIVGGVVAQVDVTERLEAEERERLLAREVDHRAKNLLAIIQAVVQLTRAEDADALKDAIIGRVQSLGRAHSLLAASRWDGVGLSKLVHEEMAPFADREAVTVEGADVQLKPAAAQSFALVLHELATNAAKYGALSVEGGHVRLAWNVDEDGLALDWTETGGPAVMPPTHRGFGSTLIRNAVERQMKGGVTFDWRAGGLHVALRLPSGQLGHLPGPAPASPGVAASDTAAPAVLIVEDEPLIAMQLEQAVADAGYAVAGPAGGVVEAIEAIYARAPVAALLDIDLAGERSWSVADVLAAKNVPFAFCSGYSAGTTLPPRFAGRPLMTKPVSPAALSELLARLAPVR